MDGPIRVDLLHGMDDRRFFEHPVLFRLAHAPGKDEAGPLVRDNGCRGRDAQGGRDDRRGQTDSGDPPDRFPLRSFRMEPLHGLRPDPAGSNELFFSDLDRDARQIVHHVGYFKLQRNNPLFQHFLQLLPAPEELRLDICGLQPHLLRNRGDRLIK